MPYPGIRYFEGFETDESLSVWESNDAGFGGSGVERSVDAARSGVYGMRPAGALGHGVAQSCLWTPTLTIIVGFAFRAQIAAGGDPAILGFHVSGGGNPQCAIVLSAQRSIGFVGGGVTIGYTERMLELDAWYYIELLAHLSTSPNGTFILRINGDEAARFEGVTTGVGSIFGGINQMFMGRGGGFPAETSEFHFDDIYVRDADEGGFLGDVEVVGVELEDDYTIQWERNSLAKNYLTVIENTPDEDTTYVETPADSVDPIKDLYEVGDQAYEGTIYAVQLVSRGRKTSTHLWHLRNVVHVSGLEDRGPDHAMAYPLYETYPPDVFHTQPNGADWDTAAFNAMKVGIEAEPFTNTPEP